MEVTPAAQRVLRIRVRKLSGSPRWLEFSVADLGQGINEETAKQLFTPFFSTKAEGMGLGLSLCRTVVEQHGGFLHFEPNKPRGTVFVFTLPVAFTDAPQPSDMADLPS
jgi:two-component system, LuxR family, sensor histidine kinase DctS